MTFVCLRFDPVWSHRKRTFFALLFIILVRRPRRNASCFFQLSLLVLQFFGPHSRFPEERSSDCKRKKTCGSSHLMVYSLNHHSTSMAWKRGTQNNTPIEFRFGQVKEFRQAHELEHTAHSLSTHLRIVEAKTIPSLLGLTKESSHV